VELNEAIVERMKELAADRNMTIHQVIQKGGLNQATISELMSGRTMHPKVSTIQKFCKGLDITLNVFFTDERFQYRENNENQIRRLETCIRQASSYFVITGDNHDYRRGNFDFLRFQILCRNYDPSCAH